MVSFDNVFSIEQNKTTGVWELVDVADRSQLGTPDRLKTKEKRIAHKGMSQDSCYTRIVRSELVKPQSGHQNRDLYGTCNF